MKTKFTPGPWEVEPESHMTMGPCVSADGDRDGGWIICDLRLPADLIGIASEDLAEKVADEREANAHLIAAAPDMYAALEEFSSEYDGFENGDGEPCPTLAKARAALAKARGEK